MHLWEKRMWTGVAQYNRLQPHINTVLMWQCRRQMELQCYTSDCDCVRRCQGWNRSTETTYQHCRCRFTSGHVRSCFRSVWYSQLGLSSVSHSKVTDHSYGQILKVVSGVGRRSRCRLVGWLVGWWVGQVRSGFILSWQQLPRGQEAAALFTEE